MYDAEHIRGFFDDYGEKEWQRFDKSLTNRVNLLIHTHFLHRFVRPDDSVLEIGAGPGRFTIELARLGARVTVGDISPVQLSLNERMVAEAGLEASVVSRDIVDVVDLSKYSDGSFDAVVCYGGPISYALDRGDQAIASLLRTVKPGGHLLFSVMSLLGSTRRFLPGVIADANTFGIEVVNRVRETGDLVGEVALGHRCHMYRWSELVTMLGNHPCRIVASAAANFLAVGNEETLQQISDDEEVWDTFMKWELEFCQQPGVIDGGTHIIAVVQRQPEQTTDPRANQPG
jgi:SAM-dependent methyltransferase